MNQTESRLTAIERLTKLYETSMVKKFKDNYGKDNKCICNTCYNISSITTWQTCKVCKKFIRDAHMCCNCFVVHKKTEIL